jgi:hypothetical protein
VNKNELKQILYGVMGKTSFDEAFKEAEQAADIGFSLVTIVPETQYEFGRIVMQRQLTPIPVTIADEPIEITLREQEWKVFGTGFGNYTVKAEED